MNKEENMSELLIPEYEWKVLKYEIFNNKPRHYTKRIVRRRELLLFAQSSLANYESTTSIRYKNFFKELYRRTIEEYISHYV